MTPERLQSMQHGEILATEVSGPKPNTPNKSAEVGCVTPSQGPASKGVFRRLSEKIGSFVTNERAQIARALGLATAVTAMGVPALARADGCPPGCIQGCPPAQEPRPAAVYRAPERPKPPLEEKNFRIAFGVENAVPFRSGEAHPGVYGGAGVRLGGPVWFDVEGGYTRVPQEGSLPDGTPIQIDSDRFHAMAGVGADLKVFRWDSGVGMSFELAGKAGWVGNPDSRLKSITAPSKNLLGIAGQAGICFGGTTIKGCGAIRALGASNNSTVGPALEVKVKF